MADAVVTAAVGFATVVALALAVVTAVSWRRDRRPRFALLALGFGVIAVKGALLSVGLWSGADVVRLLAAGAVGDAAFLGLVYVALVKR